MTELILTLDDDRRFPLHARVLSQDANGTKVDFEWDIRAGRFRTVVVASATLDGEHVRQFQWTNITGVVVETVEAMLQF